MIKWLSGSGECERKGAISVCMCVYVCVCVCTVCVCVCVCVCVRRRGTSARRSRGEEKEYSGCERVNKRETQESVRGRERHETLDMAA